MINAEDILNEYLWLIRYIVYKKVPVSDAEDVIQTIVCKICQNYRSIRNSEHIGAWIRTVVKNRIASWYRQKEQNKMQKEAYMESVMMRSQYDHDILEQMIREVMVNKVLEKLPEKFRNVLCLRYIDEFDHSEIARQLDISPADVSNRISYAKKLVRKHTSKKKNHENIVFSDSVSGTGVTL
jgi:RNA polymerase sigma factor (sigma-70 family)